MGYKQPEANIGDTIELITGNRPQRESFYRAGDKATLVEQDKDGDWWADFNDHNNPVVVRDGVWCLQLSGGFDEGHFIVITDEVEGKMNTPGMVEIPTEEYEELQNDSLFLQALIGCGVDNWDGYGDAQEMAEEMES